MLLHYHRYSLKSGLQKVKTKTALVLSALVLSLSGAGGLAIAALGSANAMPGRPDPSGQLVNFTSVPFPTSTSSASGLDNGWVTDRTFPSGGVTSTTSPDELNMQVVGADRSTAGHFYFTEGIQHAFTPGVDVVTARLYVSHDWLTKSVQAGIWGVGQDSNGAVSAYPILAFASHDTSYAANDPNYTGWEVFNDQNGGWVTMPNVPYKTDSWNTVSIAFNTSTTFDFYVNGEKAGSSYATGSANLSAVILDNFNFGGSNNYTVTWSNLKAGNYTDVTKSTCMNGGWASLATAAGESVFKNQGQCVAYANHHDGNGQDDSHVYTDNR